LVKKFPFTLGAPSPAAWCPEAAVMPLDLDNGVSLFYGATVCNILSDSASVSSDFMALYKCCYYYYYCSA